MFTRKNFKRLSEKFDCDFAPDILLAAFDGEADDAQFSRAVQHRASCASCQTLWNEWEQTRDLLLSAPAPVTPAFLKEQILIACCALPNEEFSAAPSELSLNAVPLRADLMSYLETADEEFSVARLAPIVPEIVPPQNLSRQILERTSRVEKSAGAGIWPAVRNFFHTGSTPRAPRAARWGVGVAVPGLAAWLIFAAQTSSVQTPTTQSPRVASTVSNSKIDSEKAAPNSKQKTAIFPGVQKPAPQIAALQNDAKVTVAKTWASKITPDENLEVVSLRAVAVSLKPTAQPPKTVRKNSNVKKTSNTVAPKWRPRMLALVDKSISTQKKISRVALKPSVSRVHLSTQHEDAAHRISSPALANPKALLVADARFADDDFDETLSAIARARDNRPEDLGRALDEYSASLLASNVSEDEEEDWG